MSSAPSDSLLRVQLFQEDSVPSLCSPSDDDQKGEPTEGWKVQGAGWNGEVTPLSTVAQTPLDDCPSNRPFAEAIVSTRWKDMPPRLLVSDVDSTLIDEEVIDQLATLVGCGDEVAAITDRAMRGELDFAQSLRLRVAQLRGLPVEAFQTVFEGLTIRPGARQLIDWIHRHEGKVGIVSGGFTPVVSLLAEKLNIDYYLANDLEVVDGFLTGNLVGEIVTAQTKSATLERWQKKIAHESRLPMDQIGVVALGDGANDIPMLLQADLGIAVCAKPATKSAVANYLDQPKLDAVIGLCANSINA